MGLSPPPLQSKREKKYFQMKSDCAQTKIVTIMSARMTFLILKVLS